MTYILFGSAILAGLLFRKSRFASMYIMGVMFILAFFKYNCADLSNYENGYKIVCAGLITTEDIKYVGFYLLEKLGAILKLSFQQFLGIYYCLCLFFLYIAIKKITINVNVVLSLFMIFPFALEAIQIKSFLADSLAVYGITFLLQAYKKKTEGKKYRNYLYTYIVIVSVASTVHFCVAFFLIAGIFIFNGNIEKNKYKLFGVSCVLLVLSYLNFWPQLLRLIVRYIPIVNVDYILMWLKRRTHWGIVLPIASAILLYVVSKKALQIYYHENSQRGVADIAIKECICLFSYTVCFTIAFMVYNNAFNRLFRPYALLFYVLIADLINKYVDKKNQKIALYLLASVLVGWLFYCDIIPVYKSTLGAILKYNSLIG